ncbi:MAG: hypothetical protein U5R30_21720 [Deltaproteobacteria bacterium]|nr:hypothetical protein [Deltaproteobacteria bacterium]
MAAGVSPYPIHVPFRPVAIIEAIINPALAYLSVIDRFCQDFGDCELDQIVPAAGFSDFLCGRQGDGANSRKAGWNPFATA